MDRELLVIQEIRLKVNKLLTEQEGLRERLKKLQSRVIELENELAEQKNTTKALAEQNKIVKLAVSLGNSDQAKPELRKMINGYIREIEECIRLVGDSKL